MQCWWAQTRAKIDSRLESTDAFIMNTTVNCSILVTTGMHPEAKIATILSLFLHGISRWKKKRSAGYDSMLTTQLGENMQLCSWTDILRQCQRTSDWLVEPHWTLDTLLFSESISGNMDIHYATCITTSSEEAVLAKWLSEEAVMPKPLVFLSNLGHSHGHEETPFPKVKPEKYSRCPWCAKNSALKIRWNGTSFRYDFTRVHCLNAMLSYKKVWAQPTTEHFTSVAVERSFSNRLPSNTSVCSGVHHGCTWECLTGRWVRLLVYETQPWSQLWPASLQFVHDSEVHLHGYSRALKLPAGNFMNHLVFLSFYIFFQVKRAWCNTRRREHIIHHRNHSAEQVLPSFAI